MGDSVPQPFGGHQRFARGDDVADHSKTIERLPGDCDRSEKRADCVR